MVRSIVLIIAVATVLRLTGYFTEPKLTGAEIHALAGEPDRRRGRERQSLVVVTWNIERGVQFGKIEAALKSMEPDVVLLQEVDRSCRRSGNRDVARDLANTLDMNWVSAGEFQEIGEGNGSEAAVTGQAILSRTQISDASAIVFGDQATLRWRLNPMQPRRGGRIALKARTSGLLFYNLHLESGGDDELRTAQLGDVLADDSKRSAAQAVIAGDFNNSVAFQSFMFAGLAPAGYVDALGVGWNRQTSINHRHPIDWMFVKGASASAGRIERIIDTSDHYPILATIRR